jgi:transcriptional regulator with XRE-family HTH domain
MAEPPTLDTKSPAHDADDALRQRLRVHVRALRKAAGLTLKVAAERGEIHWRHWQKIEAAKVNVSLSTLGKVARALRVDVVELFGKPAPTEGGPKAP